MIDAFNDRVVESLHGFVQLKNIPSTEALQKYYQEKYFQASGQYKVSYDEKEKSHIKNKFDLKYHALKRFLPKRNEQLQALEIGVGEGWALKCLSNNQFGVTGLDYSDFAIKTHNPDMAKHLVAGDVENSLDRLVSENRKFDLVWLDNVLEHSRDPLKMLAKCKAIANPGAILIAEVPNDFSKVQEHLLNAGHVKNPYWIIEPDHISYFSLDGLNNACAKSGWKALDAFSDFPIEVFLFNENTNYSNNKSVGRSCHLARVEIESFTIENDLETSLNLYRSMLQAGLGRQITGIYLNE